MSEGELVRTALFDAHVERGGNIVDFHGFELPIWYTSMMDEHLNTRENAGLFDVSHMGFFRFSGENVREWDTKSKPDQSREVCLHPFPR